VPRFRENRGEWPGVAWAVMVAYMLPECLELIRFWLYSLSFQASRFGLAISVYAGDTDLDLNVAR